MGCGQWGVSAPLHAGIHNPLGRHPRVDTPPFLRDTVNERAVRILLECILVISCSRTGAFETIMSCESCRQSHSLDVHLCHPRDRRHGYLLFSGVHTCHRAKGTSYTSPWSDEFGQHEYPLTSTTRPQNALWCPERSQIGTVQAVVYMNGPK